MSDREQEIEQVAASLDALLDDLAVSVAALHAILGEPPPADDGHGKEAAVR